MKDVTALAGRALMSVIFILSGFGKLMDSSHAQGMIAGLGLPCRYGSRCGVRLRSNSAAG